MGYRGTEGSRTPADRHGQRSGRPRSYSARPATGPADDGSDAPGGSGGASPGHGAEDDDAGYGTGEWAAGDRDDSYGRGATQGHDSASRGPARGFPPVPGQPDPVYPHDDFEAWSEGTSATGGHATAGQRYQDQQGHQGEVPVAGGEWDSPAAGGHWDAAPVGQWGPAGDQSEHWEQGERWDHGERWDSDDAASQPWGEGSGHWDAPYGQWDENGEWHSPDEHDGEDGEDGEDGSDQTGNGHRVRGYDRADFAIAGRDADQYAGNYADEDAANDAGRWDSANYPAYGYADEPEPAGEEDTGRRSRRGGRGRKAAPPAMSAAADAAAGRGRGRSAARRTPRGSRTRTIGLAAAGVVIVAVAAVAYFLLTGNSRHSNAAAGSSAPKLPTPTTSGSLGTSGASRLGKWGYITSRATDAAPLTVAELYPAQFLINGSSYVRTTERADTDCNQGLFGTQLQNATKVYGCTQVVRASYVSSNQTMMGTIGVVNLSSANDAAKAGNASGANDFVTPLNGKTGPTRNLSQGTGVVQAEYKGHYLILIWAEYANLKAPSTTAQRTQLEQFASGIIAGSANIALSNRMVSGHPQVTGTPG
jgi:hypothetical protein